MKKWRSIHHEMERPYSMGGRALAKDREEVIESPRRFAIAERMDTRKDVTNKLAKNPELRLRDELLALVNPETADRNCAIFMHERRRKVAGEAAMLANLLSNAGSNTFNHGDETNNSVNNNQQEDGGERREEVFHNIEVDDCQTLTAMSQGMVDELFLAAEKNDVNTVKELWRKGISLNSVRFDNESIIHIACRNGHTNLLRYCLWHQVRSDVMLESSQEHPLHLAVYGGFVDVVDVLLRHSSQIEIDRTTEFGETPLFFASRKGFHHIIRQLVYNGASMETRDRFGETAVDQASSRDIACLFKILEKNSLYKNSDWKWNSCPKSVMVQVYEYLDVVEIAHAGETCGIWYHASKDETIQKRSRFHVKGLSMLRPLDARPSSSSSSSSRSHRSTSSRRSNIIQPNTFDF